MKERKLSTMHTEDSMKKVLVFVLLFGFFSTTFASAERSPFTNISFGVVFGWGDFIKVENPQFFDSKKTTYLIEVDGKEYKDIIKEAKAIHGSKWKCRMAEHFVETMSEVGVVIRETVNLKLYLFDWGHEVFEVNNIPVTEMNAAFIKARTNFCN